MAAAGLTHVFHLLSGFESGSRVRWLTYAELSTRCARLGIPVPCSPAHFALLQSSMPQPWLATIANAISLKQINPNLNLDSISNATPAPLEAWFQHRTFAGSPTSPNTISLTHHISPVGALSLMDNPTTVSRSLCHQIHVWTQVAALNSKEARDARDRALERGEPDPRPATLLTSGPVADHTILPIAPLPPAGANPSHFCITFPPTDRVRAPVPLHHANVNPLYLAQVATLYAPVRTLNPNHIPSTHTSSSFCHLLHVPNKTIPEVRLAIATSAMRARLPAHLQETQLMVRSDALHVGDRCVKRGPTKGICDLCYTFLGTRTPETQHHILRDCPFSLPVISAIWRDDFLAHAQPSLHTTLSTLDTAAFVRRLEHRIILGVCDFETPPCPLSLHPLAAVVSAVTNAALIRRRNANALTNQPLQHNSLAIVRDIWREVCEVATALRSAAEREDTRIYTHYEGWLPEDTSMDVWLDAWTTLVRDTYPTASLHFNPQTTPGADPSFDPTASDVADRTQARAQRPTSF